MVQIRILDMLKIIFTLVTSHKPNKLAKKESWKKKIFYNIDG